MEEQTVRGSDFCRGQEWLPPVTPPVLLPVADRPLRILVSAQPGGNQQNLGHDRQKTTLDYIGSLDELHTPGDTYGTAWLQPLWEQLAQMEAARQSSGSLS